MSIAPVQSHASQAAALAASGNARALGRLPVTAQAQAVAGQFEAIMLRQFLQEGVGKMMGSGAAGGVYGYLLSDVLAAKLTEGGGLGLGKVIQQQLSPRRPEAGSAPETSSTVPGQNAP